MDWFDFVFPLVMILWPATFSLFIRHHPDPDDDAAERVERIARLRRRLWLGTVLAVTAYLALYASAFSEFARYVWVTCFPLWFAGAMPLFQAKDRGWRPLHRPEGTRAATLQRRDLEPASLQTARKAAWTGWLALFAATVWAVAESGQGLRLAWTLIFPLIGGGWLAWGAYFGRMATLEPEPIDVSASPELARGYAEFRNFKLWGWFALSVLAMLAFCTTSLLLALDPSGLMTTAIVIGAGGGSLAGVLGAAFGVRADFYRTRLHRLYQDLSENRL